MVRKLKRHFNEIFDQLYEFKDERMRQINDWRESLKSVLNELGITEGEEVESLEKRLEWMPLENPELDLPPLVGKMNKSILLSDDLNWYMNFSVSH